MAGLSSGACDYMAKPYSLDVLEQRMILRLLPVAQAEIAIRGMVLDARARTVAFEGIALSLTASEFDILHFLMKNAGIFFTSSDIYEKVWHMASLNTGTIRYHIHNLREKMLAVSKECASLLLTKFGGGYAFTGK